MNCYIQKGMIKMLMGNGAKPTITEITDTINKYKNDYSKASSETRQIILRSATEVHDGFCGRDDVTNEERERVEKIIIEFKNSIGL